MALLDSKAIKESVASKAIKDWLELQASKAIRVLRVYKAHKGIKDSKALRVKPLPEYRVSKVFKGLMVKL